MQKTKRMIAGIQPLLGCGLEELSPGMSDVGRACRRSDQTWSRRRSKAGREEMAPSGFLVTKFEDGEAVRVYSGNSNSEMRPPLSPAISEQGVDEE